MAENEVAKFSMDDVKKRLVDQIRSSFIMMMPDEAFKALIDAELKTFFAVEHVGYNQQNSRSPFQALVRAELEVTFRQLLKDELCKPEWSQYLGYDEKGQPKIGDQLRKTLTDLEPKLVESMFQGIVYNVVERIRQGN